MSDTAFDLERVKAVLRDATKTGAPFSQRSLGKEAGEGRDCVGDIINGRNLNPTTKVLANLARALGGDISMFGLAERRADPPTEAELEQALRDMLPGMPRGGLDKRARYLAETVSRALKLPRDRQSSGLHSQLIEGEEAAPPRATTN